MRILSGHTTTKLLLAAALSLATSPVRSISSESDLVRIFKRYPPARRTNFPHTPHPHPVQQIRQTSFSANDILCS
ncbi:hypothetical protein BJY52DRAFT_1287472, partial [Lactarius psammicola]